MASFILVLFFSENERGKQPENLMFGGFFQYSIRVVTAFKNALTTRYNKVNIRFPQFYGR